MTDTDTPFLIAGIDVGSRLILGTGGAPSILFAAPSWQRSVSHNAARTVPDVSYNAAIDGGVIVFYGPNVFTVGGTSAGPPQWAGIIALADELRSRSGNPPLGNGADAAIYAAAGSGPHGGNDFHDLASGLGTPDVANLIGDLSHVSSPRIGHGDDDFFGNHPGSFGNRGSRGGHVSPAG